MIYFLLAVVAFLAGVYLGRLDSAHCQCTQENCVCSEDCPYNDEEFDEENN